MYMVSVQILFHGFKRWMRTAPSEKNGATESAHAFERDWFPAKVADATNCFVPGRSRSDLV
jgi:hypothetical protein